MLEAILVQALEVVQVVLLDIIQQLAQAHVQNAQQELTHQPAQAHVVLVLVDIIHQQELVVARLVQLLGRIVRRVALVDAVIARVGMK